MTEEWRRKPDIIEGEFEVLEERYVDEVYSESGGQFVETDSSPPYATYIILGINIGAWLIMNLTGFALRWDQNMQLFRFGAKVNEMVVQGEYWRLFTAMFLHIGILHLFFNSYALYIYGPVVEKLYGKAKFIAIYILSGLMGSLFSYMFSINSAAGASGAIFGLMGSLLYFRKQRKSLFQRVFGPGLFIVIGFNLFFGVMQPGIDNWGHIGGLVGGYLAGNAMGLYREPKQEHGKRVLIWLLITFLFAVGIGYGKLKYAKEVYLKRAYVAMQNGELERAEQYITKAAHKSKKDPRIKEIMEALYIHKVQDSLKKGAGDQALEAINTLLNYDSMDLNYYYIRGQIYEEMGKFEEALKDYVYTIKTEKTSAELWFRAGRAAYNVGKLKESREYLEESLKINPNYEPAQKLLEEMKDII